MSYEDLKKEMEATEEKKANAGRKRREKGEYPPIWDYKKEGNYIVGKVLGIRYYNGRMIVEIDGEGKEGGKEFKGERTIFAPMVLERKLKELKVNEGDIVGIKQIGMRKGKKWDYYDFRVVKK